MDKDVLVIDRETFIKLGIHPQEAIDYILNKKATTLNPVDVKALQVLKRKPVVPAS